MKARIVVLETVYYQPDGGQPVADAVSYSRKLSGGWPAKSERTVGADSSPLLPGASGPASSVSVRSLASPECCSDGGGTLTLAVDGVDCIEVPPGESCRFRPSDVSRWTVRGPGVCSVAAYPE